MGSGGAGVSCITAECRRQFHILINGGEAHKLMPVDPVCGIELDEKLALVHQHKGKTYYFCCNGCRLLFTKPRWWR